MMTRNNASFVSVGGARYCERPAWPLFSVGHRKFILLDIIKCRQNGFRAAASESRSPLRRGSRQRSGSCSLVANRSESSPQQISTETSRLSDLVFREVALRVLNAFFGTFLQFFAVLVGIGYRSSVLGGLVSFVIGHRFLLIPAYKHPFTSFRREDLFGIETEYKARPPRVLD
jgi:hypothetical protein